MLNMPAIPIHPQRPRKQLGFLEEYWKHAGNRTWIYVGWIKVDESAQAIGSDHMVELTNLQPMEAKRGIDRVVKIKPRTWLRRMVSPLQGREET